MDFLAQEFISWIPRSPEELTLELQLACVHSRVCMLAAVARIGVPDPEDSFLMLFLPHKKARLVVAFQLHFHIHVALYCGACCVRRTFSVDTFNFTPLTVHPWKERAPGVPSFFIVE